MQDEMDDTQTGTIREKDPDFVRAMSERSKHPSGTALLGGKQEVMLLIDNDVKRFPVQNDVRWLLGRFDEKTDHPDQIDLTPYDARERGVSRFHLQLQIENEQLLATDLNSTNGTYRGGELLPKNKPVLIRNGDMLQLGRLTIQVLFR